MKPTPHLEMTKIFVPVGIWRNTSMDIHVYWNLHIKKGLV